MLNALVGECMIHKGTKKVNEGVDARLQKLANGANGCVGEVE